jgi:hypothetical protein
MLKRAVFCVLLSAIVMLGVRGEAGAAIADPGLGAVSTQMSGITTVRWVCGPYRCAYLPRYRGRVVVRPYMRRWRRPPNSAVREVSLKLCEIAGLK